MNKHSAPQISCVKMCQSWTLNLYSGPPALVVITRHRTHSWEQSGCYHLTIAHCAGDISSCCCHCRNHKVWGSRGAAQEIQREGVSVLHLPAEHPGRGSGPQPAGGRHRGHLRQRLEPPPGKDTLSLTPCLSFSKCCWQSAFIPSETPVQTICRFYQFHQSSHSPLILASSKSPLYCIPEINAQICWQARRRNQECMKP